MCLYIEGWSRFILEKIWIIDYCLKQIFEWQNIYHRIGGWPGAISREALIGQGQRFVLHARKVGLRPKKPTNKNPPLPKVTVGEVGLRQMKRFMKVNHLKSFGKQYRASPDEAHE